MFFLYYFDEYKGFYLLFGRLNFFKKRGGIAKVHMVFRGGCPKVHDGPQGGRGGQKIPKIGPHGLRMAPYFEQGTKKFLLF